MHIALGTTLLKRDLNRTGLDGIGVYTQALLHHLKNYSELSLYESAFSESGGSMFNSFRAEIMCSTFTGLPFYSLRNMEKNIDLFHATDHYIPKLAKTPVLATLMDPIPLMRPDWANTRGRKLKNYFFRSSAQWASHYITISEAVIPDLVNYFGIKEEKITPIHLGVNMEDFAPVTEETKTRVLKKLGLSIDRKNGGYFLFVGTLQPRKNVHRIIEAFSSLPKEIQQAYPLVIAGREGWSSEATVEKLKKLITAGVAHWLGYISFSDKVVLLQTATALVFPSLYEGFGLPVIEAFASGLPVITSNTSSLPETAGEAAYLVDPLDTEALTEAMKKVVYHPEIFQPLIEKGYSRAAQMTWAHCIKKTVDVYKTLI
jgi:alpha-1,3-rhamnosyl/mannosyltransferase